MSITEIELAAFSLNTLIKELLQFQPFASSSYAQAFLTYLHILLLMITAEYIQEI